MNKGFVTLLVAGLGLTLAGAASAQNSSATSDAGHPSSANPIELPEGCRSANQMAQNSGMQGGMMQNMQGMMSGMDDAHKGYMDAMARMNPAMMQGMMAKDTDVAFICSMIAHHQGAIEMAKTEIKYGDDSEAKKMAEKSMKEQERETKEMTEWVQKHTKK